MNAWGSAWGKSWGVAWGGVVVPPVLEPGGGPYYGGRRRRTDDASEEAHIRSAWEDLDAIRLAQEHARALADVEAARIVADVRSATAPARSHPIVEAARIEPAGAVLLPGTGEATQISAPNWISDEEAMMILLAEIG